MKNPVKKYMDKIHKPKTHHNRSKYNRVKEKCSHWDLDWLGWDSYDKASTNDKDGETR